MKEVLAYVAARLIDKDGNPIDAGNPLPAGPSGAGTKFVRVNARNDGVNPLVAPVAGKKIRVLGYVLTATAAGIIALQDTAGTPVIHAELSVSASGGASYAGGPDAPAFETAVGEGVQVFNPAGVDTLGHLAYSEVA